MYLGVAGFPDDFRIGLRAAYNYAGQLIKEPRQTISVQLPELVRSLPGLSAGTVVGLVAVPVVVVLGLAALLRGRR